MYGSEKEALNKIFAKKLCGVYILYAHWNEYDWNSIVELIYFPIYYYLLSHFEHLNCAHQSKSKSTSNKLNILSAKLPYQTIKEFLLDEYMFDVILFLLFTKADKIVLWYGAKRYRKQKSVSGILKKTRRRKKNNFTEIHSSKNHAA